MLVDDGRHLFAKNMDDKSFQRFLDSELSPTELVDHAMTDSILFKNVGRQLEKLPPNETAASRTIEAYSAGTAEPWLAAFLLGCCRHPIGLTTVEEILLTKTDKGAASYAAVALVDIIGQEARQMLMQIIANCDRLAARRGAASGLTVCDTPPIATELRSAVDHGRLPAGDAAWAIATSTPDDAFLLDFLGPLDSATAQFNYDVLEAVLRYRNSAEPGPRVKAAVAEWLAEFPPDLDSTARRLRDWIASV